MIVCLAPHTQAGRRELRYNAGVAEGVAAGISALRRELLRLRCDLQVTARRKLQHVPAQALRWELQFCRRCGGNCSRESGAAGAALQRAQGRAEQCAVRPTPPPCRRPCGKRGPGRPRLRGVRRKGSSRPTTYYIVQRNKVYLHTSRHRRRGSCGGSFGVAAGAAATAMRVASGGAAQAAACACASAAVGVAVTGDAAVGTAVERAVRRELR